MVKGAGELLGLLRHGRSLTRAEIVAASGLARATVTHRLDALIEHGFVAVTPGRHSTGGRPAEELGLNPARGALLVADIGSSHLRVGIADLAGDLLAVRDHDVEVADGPGDVLALVRDDMADLVEEVGVRPDAVLAAAVGVPGPVEHTTGRLVSPPTMPGWDGFDVQEFLRESFNVPVVVDKDANIMALGEQRALHDLVADLLVLKIGMGIGAGIIARGEIMRGSRGAAGDLGHLPREGGARCRCGQFGCAEATAGGWAIAEHLRAHGHPQVRTSSDIVRLAREADPLTVELLQAAGRRVGEAVADAVGLLNPAMVIVGGNLAEAGAPLVDGIRQQIFARSHPLATDGLEVVTSSLGADAGLAGAAQLAADAGFSTARINAVIGANITFD